MLVTFTCCNLLRSRRTPFVSIVTFKLPPRSDRNRFSRETFLKHGRGKTRRPLLQDRKQLSLGQSHTRLVPNVSFAALLSTVQFSHRFTDPLYKIDSAVCE
jgi:hypothetical protein